MAATVWVADYTRRIAPASLSAAGVSGVCRYIANSSAIGKIIGRAEFEELNAAGQVVCLNWEEGDRDWLRGSAGARTDAADAIRIARSLGYPAGDTIPGSADWDMTWSEWTGVCRGYADTWRKALNDGGYRAGVYGSTDTLTWCAELGGFDMFWQSLSTGFSGGRNGALNPHTTLWQRGRQTINGQEVDRNTIAVPDWKGSAMTVGLLNRLRDDPDFKALITRWDSFLKGLPVNPDDPSGHPYPLQTILDIQATKSQAAANGGSLTELKAALAAMVAPQVPALTQEQVNAAMTEALKDPAVVAGLAAAIAAHVKVV